MNPSTLDLLREESRRNFGKLTPSHRAMMHQAMQMTIDYLPSLQLSMAVKILHLLLETLHPPVNELKDYTLALCDPTDRYTVELMLRRWMERLKCLYDDRVAENNRRLSNLNANAPVFIPNLNSQLLPPPVPSAIRFQPPPPKQRWTAPPPPVIIPPPPRNIVKSYSGRNMGLLTEARHSEEAATARAPIEHQTEAEKDLHLKREEDSKEVDREVISITDGIKRCWPKTVTPPTPPGPATGETIEVSFENLPESAERLPLFMRKPRWLNDMPPCCAKTEVVDSEKAQAEVIAQRKELALKTEKTIKLTWHSKDEVF